MKKGLKTVCVGTFLAGIIFSSSVLAVDTDFQIQVTDAFEKWNQLETTEKEETFMPKTYTTIVPESVLEEYKENNQNQTPNLLSDLLKGKQGTNCLDPVKTSFADESYNIADRLSLRIEHQGTTAECWAFAMIKSLETNIALRSGVTEIPDFSERHMDYATSRTFLDGINEKGFKREVGEGGLPISALAYLTNGQGAVLESQMPFQDNEQKINLSEIDKPVDTVVTEYVSLPTLSKTYEKDASGNTTRVIYSDGAGNVYTDEQVEAARNLIKQSIVENGAIPSLTAASYPKYYNQTNIWNATAYNCNDTGLTRDHGITIVGWDDHYSRNNFAEGVKPSKDGAYIVLNSYGENAFDKGYIYISYEDYFIESELYSIKNTKKVDYDHIYQSDFYGGVFAMGTMDTDTGYYANTFTRDASKKEYINSVGVTLTDYVSLEIYINPSSDSKDKNLLIKVGESNGILEPGYHRLDVRNTELLGENFTIVIKQKSSTGRFYFTIETPVENTPYALVTSEQKSYYSKNGEQWYHMAETQMPGYDMEKTDVCIKAFTTEENPNDNPQKPDDPEEKDEITSNKYTIQEDTIYRIDEETSFGEFKQNIYSDLEINVLDGETPVTADNQIIKTGMKLQLPNGKEYELIVRGDINCDGVVSLTDISKLVLHYNETRNYILTGAPLKAADMNFDSKVSLIDVSQMLVLYNAK